MQRKMIVVQYNMWINEGVKMDIHPYKGSYTLSGKTVSHLKTREYDMVAWVRALFVVL